MKPIFSFPLAVRLAAAAIGLCAIVAATPTRAADGDAKGPEDERELIRVLTSDAPPAEKAITCKRLAVWGGKASVPALGALLSDKDLASWSRIALEAIPDPSADEALRKAMGRVQGKLLVGVINSIAVRRDAKAVSGLSKKLNDSDAEVASAAAVALGRIGGMPASKALSKAFASTRSDDRPAVAHGCVLCAEGFLAQGKTAEAIKLYDQVRQANDVPKQKLLEATRGAILARGDAGLPLLLDQLRSPDKAMVGIGLHTARELPGRQVSEALVAELNRCSAERQPFLLLALADRNDPAVLPAVIEAARSGSKKLRLTAVGALDRLGNPSSMPVLLEAAAQDDAELTSASLAALARLPGNEVDAEVLDRLPKANGKMRKVLIEVAGQRGVEKALPAIVQSAEDPDSGVRQTAVKVLGAVGSDKEAAELVRLLPKTQSTKQRADIETALISISGRSGTGCVPHLQALAQSQDSNLRMIALHTLASAGGSQALAAVSAAVEDKDEAVQDEAVRTLSTWPDNWPDDSGVAEPLLGLAKSGKKESHQTLALRGYLHYLKNDKQLKDDERVTKVNDLQSLLKRPEEKRLAITAIDNVPSAPVLELLTSYAAQSDTAEDACTALLGLADKDRPGLSTEQRRKALQTILDNSKNQQTKKKADDTLKSLK